MSSVTPGNCPRFEGCSANICPLDADWRLRWHLEHERVCGLLTESVKPAGEANLRGVLPAKLVSAVLGERSAICARWGAIRRRLERASKTGSKLANAERLRAGP